MADEPSAGQKKAESEGEPREQEPSVETKQKERRRRGGVAGPVILICVGIVFLLNNLGLLPWDVWDTLWRAWPVVLILIGLDLLIGRRSVWGTLAVALIALAVLAAVLSVAISWPFPSERVEDRVMHALDSATRAEVTLEPGIARLRLGSSEDTGTLASGTISRAKRDRLVDDFRISGDTARLRLGTEGRRFVVFSPPSGDWNLKLGPVVPVTLNVDTGFGEVDLDLRGLNLSEFEVKGGVGTTKVSLPASGTVTGTIDGGVGETTIVIPKAVQARVSVETGIGDVDVPNSYTREDDVYLSPSTESTSTLDLDVKSGIGEVTIKESP